MAEEGRPQDDHRPQPPRPPPHTKRKRPRTISIREIKNDPVVEEQVNDDDYITSEDEAPPDPGVNRVSWDQFLGFPQAKKVKERLQTPPPMSHNDDDDEELKTPAAKKRRKITFNRGLRRLEKFKEKHGTLEVPRGYGADPTFEAWLDQLRRKFHKKGQGKPTKLSDEQYDKLQKLGFQVSETKQKKTEFDKRLGQLRKFKREYNHVKVPKGYTDIQGLRAWIIRIRNQFREKEKGNPSELTDDQINDLNTLGFFWNNKNKKRGGKVSGGTKTINSEATTKNGEFLEPDNFKDAKSEPATVLPQPPSTPANFQTEEAAATSTPEFAERLRDLQAFKVAFKSTYIPEDYEGLPGLRDWTVDVRKQYWEMVGGCPSGLSDGQIYELNELGFDWEEEGPTNAKSNQENDQTLDLYRDQQEIDISDRVAKQLISPFVANPREANETVGEDQDTTTFGSEGESLAQKLETTMNPIQEDLFPERESRLEMLQRPHSPVNLQSTSHEPSNNNKLSEPPSHIQPTTTEGMEPTNEKSTQPCDTNATSSIQPAERYRDREGSGILSDNKNLPKTLSPNTSCKIHINSWLARIEKLKEYKTTYGNMNIPEHYPDDQHFADWFHEQKRDFSRRWNGDLTALSDERFNALQGLGFVVEQIEVVPLSFDERVSQLKSFFETHGHAKVPKKHLGAPGLRKWLFSVRTEFKVLERGGEANLSFREIEILNSLDFQWRGKKAKKASKKQDMSRKASTDPLQDIPAGSHSNVSTSACSAVLEATEESGKIPDNREQQRHYSKDNSLQASFDALIKPNKCGEGHHLKTNGLPLSSLKDVPNAMEIQNGNCSVSLKVAPSSAAQSLEQRNANGDEFKSNGSRASLPTKESSITNDQTKISAASLSTAGAPSRNHSKQDTPWGGRLKQLEEYKALNGNVDVPLIYEPDQGFATWVRTQRRLFSKRVGGLRDALSDERFQLLEKVGFGSNTASQHPAKTSDSKAPATDVANKRAANGITRNFRQVGSTPSLHNHGQNDGSRTICSEVSPSVRVSVKVEEPPSSPPRINKLVGVWGERFKQLKEYKAMNGSIEVPLVYEPDQAFATWVRTQRRLFSKRVNGLVDALSDESFDLLKSIGFGSSNSKQAAKNSVSRPPARNRDNVPTGRGHVSLTSTTFKQVDPPRKNSQHRSIPKMDASIPAPSMKVEEPPSRPLPLPLPPPPPHPPPSKPKSVPTGRGHVSLTSTNAEHLEPPRNNTQHWSNSKVNASIAAPSIKVVEESPPLLQPSPINLKFMPTGRGHVSLTTNVNQVEPPRNNTQHRSNSKVNGSIAAPSIKVEELLPPPPPPPSNPKFDSVWGGRLVQLQEYDALNGNTRVPNLYEPDQGFANWVKMQRRLFSARVRGITDAISDDKFFALQRLGFEPKV